jgi:hypothetical protein
MASLNKLNWSYKEQVLNPKQSNKVYHPNPTNFKPGSPVIDKVGTYLMPGELKHPPNTQKKPMLLPTNNNNENFSNKLMKK